MTHNALRPTSGAAESGKRTADSLNEAQRLAVCSTAATVAILAGPGSGKTHTLTSRVAWLVDEAGFAPQDVIVATFTVKAAREMQERLGRALGDGRQRKLVLGTFHSIARRYLAAYGKKIGVSQKFAIADSSDSKGVIERICKRLKLSCDPAGARAWISKKKAKGTVGQDPVKGGLARAPGLRDLETCFSEYQTHLERSNLLDYDDLLVKCVELLREHPVCVSNVQAVLIDEFQDTNAIQYELMKLFAQRHRRITIVGDADQSIYGWRSAEIGNLHRLLREYRGTREISLEENYRSSQMIIDVSLLVIQQDQKRYKKVLKPIHNKGTCPVLRKLKTPAKEAEWIVSELRRVQMMSGEMLTNSDIAILLRSAALSRHVESALGKAGIAYKMVGGFKFYDRMEIKTVLDYLRVIHQPDNNDALARVMNVPRRGIGEVTVKKLIEEAEESKLSLWGLLTKHCRGERATKTKLPKQAEQRMNGELLRLIKSIRQKIEMIKDGTPYGLVEMIEQLLTNLRFEKFLKDAHPEDHEQRWANVQEFVMLAKDYLVDLEKDGDDSLPEVEGVPQSKEADVLPKFLANVSLASDVLTEDDGQAKPLVTISTIHASKGLEWPMVFVPGVYRGSIPHSRSEDDDEERRLLYVAMTRAQAFLYLSYPTGNTTGNGENNFELSPFVVPVEKVFASRGPSLDRPVMEKAARILGRQLPSEKAIYDKLPARFPPEDNIFPEDPDQVQKQAWACADGYYNDGHDLGDIIRCKRPKVALSSSYQLKREEVPWAKGYATTMDESPGFTVGSLPGFVNVMTQQAAITAATEATSRAKETQRLGQKGPKHSFSNKTPGQRSIMGFVRPMSKPEELMGPRTSTPTITTRPVNHGQFVAQAALLVSTPIKAEFSSHKLGVAKGQPPSRPTAPKRAADDGARNPYACFSSPPKREEAGREDGADDGKSNLENELPPSPKRPASCLHQTTCNGPMGRGGMTKRPATLNRSRITGGIVPMKRLTRPFKPLTINRQ